MGCGVGDPPNAKTIKKKKKKISIPVAIVFVIHILAQKIPEKMVRSG